MPDLIKNIHEKLMTGVKYMLIDTEINLPFYGELNLQINFHQNNSLSTCGVNMSNKGMNFYYSSSFLDKLSQKEVNFIILHENFHLLFDHPKRTISGEYNHSLANVAQDMIINHIIFEDISHDFIEIPKGENGKNMALMIPKEYEGELIFEKLYEWLKKDKEEYDKKNQKDKKDKKQNKKDNSGGVSGSKSSNSENVGENAGENTGKGDKDDGDGGNNESRGDGDYGPYGKNPKGSSPIDTWSKEKIYDDLNNDASGEYLDEHLEDSISEDLRETVIDNTIDRIKSSLKSRGESLGNTEETLSKLKKKRKNYLKYIKRAVSNTMVGDNKEKTISRPHRRQIKGMKGKRKVKNKINCVLDTSGSMGGLFEKVLSYIYRNDIETNLIEADTEVRWVENVKNKKKLESLKIKGLGGTILQPAIDYVEKNLNEYNNLIITDGYTDSLDFSKIKGKVLILSIGSKVQILKSNNKVKQILIEEGYE